MNIVITPNTNSPVGNNTNFSVIQGETVAVSVSLINNGVAWNISGYSLKMQIRIPTGNILLTTGNGGLVITNASGGIFTINILSSACAVIPPGNYPWDLFVDSGASPSVETAILAGTFAFQAAQSPVP